MTAPARKFAVISSDVNENYSFFLPVAARAWRALGWTPLCLLVGTTGEWEENPGAFLALENLSRGDAVTFVRPSEGYRISTTAQLIRLLAAALPSLRESDYLLTSDVDMIPLDGGHFLKQDWSMDFNILGADAYGDITKGILPPKFPMCYLGARVSAWRDVMGLSSGDLDTETRKALAGRPDHWDNDEMYFASKLHGHRFYAGSIEKVSEGRYKKGRCDLLMRGWPYGRALRRVDREAWGFSWESGMIDCHCQRPGFKDPKVLRAVVGKYFPKESAWFDRYLGDYLRT